ncbi:sulfite exporter TauE/SafE family protein [Parashewanella curva]|uniref:Probable membrane transporter protein n=1 Tax=Parashewanella curva TaxID=2338552 RepID=A0A3L8PWJ2_9GAMM|nr:sulfite exporter TauE/SafE family protein [Parashewanella curva]RLV59661.1 sulfite exporter TauE/SafE family protein [Parashewanella curva]
MITTFILLLLIIVIGTYFQTATGFGLGIIVTGLATALGLAELSFIAAVVSLVTLVNCLTIVPKSLYSIDWKIAIFAGLAIIPGVILGVQLLSYLSDSATAMLQALLGLMIIISGISSISQVSHNQDKPRGHISTFSIAGFASGFTGGLFGMAGPPLVFHFYRQPFSIVSIRNLLLLLFACSSASRSLFLWSQDLLTTDILLLSALAIPLVSITTMVAMKYPIPLKPQAMKKVVFVLLMVLGGYLVTKSLVTFS